MQIMTENITEIINEIRHIVQKRTNSYLYIKNIEIVHSFNDEKIKFEELGLLPVATVDNVTE